MSINLKPCVVTEGLRYEMWIAVGAVAAARWLLFGEENTTITAALDGKHMQGSLHAKGLALDFRTNDLSPSEAGRLTVVATKVLEPLGYDVVHETIPEHLHIEFDPKAGEELLVRLPSLAGPETGTVKT